MPSLKSLATLIISSVLFSSCATSPVEQGRIKINLQQPEYKQNQVSYPLTNQTLDDYTSQEKDLVKEGEIMRKKFEELNQYLIKITR
jgi:hypothetical protein